MSGRVPFSEINAVALAQFPSLLARWLPDGKRVCGEWVARNPTRDDRKPGSFTINMSSGKWIDFATGGTHGSCDRGGDPISLYAYVEGLGDYGRAANQLAQELGLSAGGEAYRKARPSTGVRPASPKTVEAKVRSERVQKAHKLWSFGKPAQGTLVQHYLASRAIHRLPKTIRYADLYHPSLPKRQSCPAMMAAIWDANGKLCGVHRTFLAEPGRKADLDPVKMMAGVAIGGAVRLSRQSPNLLIGEGIESALSLLELCPDWTVWAALSANGLAQLAVPDWVKTVVVVADHDSKFDQKTQSLRRVGVNSAIKGLEAMELSGRRTAWVELPAGLDPNDFMLKRADRVNRFCSYIAGFKAA